jgi:hypothetical protein
MKGKILIAGMKRWIYDLIGIAVLFAVILLLTNWGRMPAQAPFENCFSRERLNSTIAGGVRLMIVEGFVYNISNWTDTSYPSGVFVLKSELSAEELANLSAPIGALCTRELENVSYSATIGVSDGTKDLVAMLVNKTVETLKEEYKKTANKGNRSIGWLITSRTTIKEIDDICEEDADLIFTDQPPSMDKLASCGRRAFVAGGGNVSRVYIIRSNVSNTFFEPLLLKFNAMPGYERLGRYTG